MNIKLQLPKLTDLRPRLTVIGVGGAGSNAVNNMITSGLSGVTFVVANTDAQSLANSTAEHRVQLGANLTEGLGAGARPEIGEAAAEEAIEEIRAQVAGSHMVFIAAGMGGGTGTGAAAVIARIARESGALTVGVITKPFQFEGTRRMRAAEAGVAAMKPHVDTLIVIPNQNLFRIATEKTTFSEAFVMADQVLYSGIACVVDLIVKEGLINLDFADVRTIMSGMGTAMMGTGEASGEKRAVLAAEEAISNPLLDDISLRGAKGLLVSITGGRDLTLYEVDEAATRVRQEVDPEANIIVGASFDDTIGDRLRVSIVASGMERLGEANQPPVAPVFNRAAAAAAPLAALEVAAPVQANAAAMDANLARALSEAIGSPRSEPAHGQPYSAGYQHGQSAPQARPAWESASGAVFAESPPHIGRGAPAAYADVQPNFEAVVPGEGAFSPQAPTDVGRNPRRLPAVEDFPVVGQREYHAKAEHYADPPSAPPRAYANPAPEPARKRSFFERLTGARRDESPKGATKTPYPQVSGRIDRPADQLDGQGRGRPAEMPRNSRGGVDEHHDLPVFFGNEKK